MAGTEESPYRVGNWTVTKLKTELKARNSPITGDKETLIRRLEDLGHETSAKKRYLQVEKFRFLFRFVVSRCP